MLASLAPRLPRSARRRGFTLIELLTVVVVIGILVSIAVPSFTQAQDKARNASVQSSVHSVRMGLEMYMTSSGGGYPSALLGSGAGEDYLIDLSGARRPGYVSGDQLPASPWSPSGGARQATNIAPTGVAFQSASAVANGTSVSSTRDQMIGRGRMPGKTTPPAAATDFGAISYELDPASSLYVLYGTGRRGSYAVISHGVSNGSN